MRKASQGRTKHGDRGWHGMWDDKMSGRVSTVNIACLLGENSSYTRYRVLLEGVTTTKLTMYTVKYDSRESLQVVFLRLNIIRCCTGRPMCSRTGFC